jgi:hypothetical protein
MLVINDVVIGVGLGFLYLVLSSWNLRRRGGMKLSCLLRLRCEHELRIVVRQVIALGKTSSRFFLNWKIVSNPVWDEYNTLGQCVVFQGACA